VTRRPRPGEPLHAVSLFTNCGAGDVGFASAGFSFDVLAELDARRLEVAALNLPDAEVVSGDLRDTWTDVVRAFRRRAGEESPALLAACPPCQGMSSARGSRGAEDDAEAGSLDERNLLVTVIAQVAHALKPLAIVVENVPAFLTRQVKHPKRQTGVSAALLLTRSLTRHYRAYPFLADLADYGIPQTRRRAFIVYLRRDEPAVSWLAVHKRFPFPAVIDGASITLEAALEQLHARPLDPRRKATAGRGMHVVPVWDQRRYEMVSAIPPRSGRGAWQNEYCGSCGDVPVHATATTCPHCGGPLARPVVLEDGCYRFIRGFRTSSYTRMRPDTPAATITTASGFIGSDKTLHPWEDRVLSLTECAYLQTFPRRFRWGEALREYGPCHVRAMIGEAVPPRFTRRHGLVLRSLLMRGQSGSALAAGDDRVAAALRRMKRARSEARRASASPACLSDHENP